MTKTMFKGNTGDGWAGCTGEYEGNPQGYGKTWQEKSDTLGTRLKPGAADPIAFGPPAPGPRDVGISGCMVSWAGCLVGWLIGCLAGWLAVKSTKLEVENHFSWL